MKRLSVFSGDVRPTWSPQLQLGIDPTKRVKKYLKPIGLSPRFSECFYITDNFVDQRSCENLISEFSQQIVSPVGISGYSTNKPTEIGSYRKNAWTMSIAEQLSAGFKIVLSDEETLVPELNSNEAVFLNLRHERVRMPIEGHSYHLLGSTPFMRFMKYPSGGHHVPHYDAPFIKAPEFYLTLMSWVLFLNTPMGNGGEFQFVDDGQWEMSPYTKKKADWERMATEKEVLESVSPKEGRLLIFPHWLAHQVSIYTSAFDSWRYIIRGDVAYEYHVV